MKTIHILFASETGTAEDVAFDIYTAIVSIVDPALAQVRLSSLDELQIDLLPTIDVAVFIVSTTGDGDAPSNMQNFWKFLLRRSLSNDCLSKVQGAVFGLGDSSYEKFNAAARKLFVRLQQLGMKQLLPIGLGDDQARHGYFSQWNGWSKSLLQQLNQEGYTRASPVSTVSSTFPPLFDVTVLDEGSARHDASVTASYPLSSHSIIRFPLSGAVLCNNRTTRDSWAQEIRHVVVEFDNRSVQTVDGSVISELSYRAGDVASVCPINDPSVVGRTLNVVAEKDILSLEKQLQIAYVDPNVYRRPSFIPAMTCSVGQLFSEHLDLQGVPRRSFFARISAHATNDEERDKLLELSSEEGNDLYFDYVVHGKRNHVDVLEDFRSCRPTLACLISAIPRLMPRKYSIASSALMNPTRIELCVAVTKARSKHGRTRIGTCSGYLARVVAGDSVKFLLERGAISNANISLDKPVLLIGPGTGVAPVRALVYERLLRRLNQDENSEPARDRIACASDLLAFGCRRRDADFLYAHEWAALTEFIGGLDQINYSTKTAEFISSHNSTAIVPRLYSTPTSAASVTSSFEYGSSVESDGTAIPRLVRVLVAFSQDQDKKVYVMDALRAHAESVEAVIRAGGTVVVCGAAKNMPKDVRNAVKLILIDSMKGAPNAAAEADRIMMVMDREKRYIVEAWS